MKERSVRERVSPNWGEKQAKCPHCAVRLHYAFPSHTAQRAELVASKWWRISFTPPCGKVWEVAYPWAGLAILVEAYLATSRGQRQGCMSMKKYSFALRIHQTSWNDPLYANWFFFRYELCDPIMNLIYICIVCIVFMLDYLCKCAYAIYKCFGCIHCRSSTSVSNDWFERVSFHGTHVLEFKCTESLFWNTSAPPDVSNHAICICYWIKVTKRMKMHPSIWKQCVCSCSHERSWIHV